jgi:hypothetical protein
MAEKGSDGGQTRPEEVAAYIAVMTAEMVRLARSHNLLSLAYLLDVARMEAIQCSQDAPNDKSERIA